MSAQIRDFIPDIGKQLASYKGAELIERIGKSTVKDVVCGVLCGSNIRSLTEILTRKRLALSNAALLATYLDAGNSIQGLQKNLLKLVGKELTKSKLTNEEKQYLQWFAGLTGKGIQNILRGGKQEFIEYLGYLENSIEESAGEAKEAFGDLTGMFCANDKTTNISWRVLMQIFTAIGAQTLAIRGSEKSMYGKLFEKFILGSLLTILGFSYSELGHPERDKMIFWLSDRGNKRESDATILVKPGVGARFDIGFIGPGNTEISLDKVTRFEAEMEVGRQTHFMSTLIIVDRIGEGSRIAEIASEIGGNIIQMSMSFWVKEVAQILKQTAGFEHEILKMTDKESLKYIRDSVAKIELKNFIQ